MQILSVNHFEIFFEKCCTKITALFATNLDLTFVLASFQFVAMERGALNAFNGARG